MLCGHYGFAFYQNPAHTAPHLNYSWSTPHQPKTNSNKKSNQKKQNRTDNPKEVSNKHLYFKDEETESQNGSLTVWRREKVRAPVQAFSFLGWWSSQQSALKFERGYKWRIRGYKIKLSSKGFPVGAVVKNSLTNVGAEGDLDLTAGLGRSSGGGNGYLLQHSCLENPMDRGAWPAAVQRFANSWTQLSDWAHMRIQTLQVDCKRSACWFTGQSDVPGICL